MRHTLGDLVDFVISNRTKKVFSGWSPIEIADAIIEAVEDNVFVYSCGADGRINGLVQGRKFRGPKVIYVCNVLTTKRGALKEFVKWFQNMYPGWSLEANRRERNVKYRTSRLCQLVNVTQ